MMPFMMLSALTRALFALWALLLCLTDISSAVVAAVKKHLRFTALAVLILAPVYFMWQVIFDISLFGNTDKASAISASLGGLPWAYCFAVLTVLTLASILLLCYNIRYDKTNITPGAIKLFLDRIPCGICCWRDSGRVLFSNICMNHLCAAVTDSPLLNGSHFRKAVEDRIITVEGKVWRFSCRDIQDDGETLHEMVASDITAEYAKTEALEKDKAELSDLNRKLREYYLSIDDTVRRQEILQAKVNIHDEMNRLMLSTTAANTDDTKTLDQIFSLWERNALLLCMEADSSADVKAADSLNKLADALKIHLIWHSDLPESLSVRQRGLFFSTAQEAIINAVKHAAAKTMKISFEETDTYLYCRFINDGEIPSSPVRFTGGLQNLSVFAEQQGATVTIEVDDGFTLTLRFPHEA